MRKTVVVATCFALLGLVLGLATPAAASDAFTGTWTAIDSDDGSLQTLLIGGSGEIGWHSVVLLDEADSVCGGGPALWAGRGRSNDDDFLFALLTLTCPGSGAVFTVGLSPPTTYGFFYYDPATDTLQDDGLHGLFTTYYRTS
jgi:hypothetical protein